MTSTPVDTPLDEFASLEGLLGRKEPLCAALAAWYEPGPPFAAVRHPLLYAVPHFPGTEALLNAQLAAREQACAQARAEQNWERYVWLHERPWRAWALLEVAAQMAHAAYWALVGRTYVDSENVVQAQDQWQALFGAPRAAREHLMLAEERAALAQLPEQLTVWCGCRSLAELDGWSWSLSRKTALWFAQRTAWLQGVPAVLVQGEVRRADVLAFFTRRGESEVLVAPERVRARKVVQRLGARADS